MAVFDFAEFIAPFIGEAPEVKIMYTIFIVLFCAILVLLAGRKFRIPIIIGYFITGIILGPDCLHIVDSAQVDVLAEFGVILLMFTIGLEISLKNLLSMKKIVLIGGSLQLLVTTAAVCAIMMAFGFSFNVSVFIGFLVAHSSTAIIMNIYQKSGEVDKQHGKISLGLLIFQDLNVVPMMMLVPLLAGNEGTDIIGEVISFFIGLAIMLAILAAAIFLVPKILKHIALTRNSELFVIAVVVICFGIAWLMNINGVSLALGAFLAGVAISGSDYSHEVIGQVAPIRDILSSFFFVSIGVMLNLEVVLENILPILGIAVLLMVGKTIINFFSVKVLGIATGACVLSAVGLSQIGEFSFILGKEGLNAGILSPNIYNSFLAISIITMAITPFVVSWLPKFVTKHFTSKVPKEENAMATDERHEIIVGFGLAGRYVARALKKLNIPYIIIEMNAQTVEAEKKNGENIIYGDASRDAILDYAGIMKAQSIVISIPQMDAVKAIITTARRLNPQITIITRSRFISETSELYRLGADEVIVDERESAVQIFKRILASKQLPVQDIEALSREMRSKLYNQYIETPNVLANPGSDVPKLFDTLRTYARHADSKVSSEMSRVEQMRVEPGSALCNKKLSEVHLRRDYGISVLAIRHEGETDAAVSPDGEVRLREGDNVVLIGQQKALNKVVELFNPILEN